MSITDTNNHATATATFEFTSEQWKAEGEARLLIRALERKFGTLDEDTRALIYRLDTDTLLDCVERVGSAPSIAAVLSPQTQSIVEQIEIEEDIATVVDDNYPSVVRTKKGLALAGTRLMLYDLMDYRHQNWSTGRIQQWFRLTDQQVRDSFEFLSKYQFEVETEYRQVLNYAEEKHLYWREQQRNLVGTATVRKSGRTDFWATLRNKQLERAAE